MPEAILSYRRPIAKFPANGRRVGRRRAISCVGYLLVLLVTPALAQILEDKSLQEQLVPESFKLEASATAAKANDFDWRTTVSYSIVNNSGMNLYVGVMMGSVSIGTCTDFRGARGGLLLLPGPNAIAYAVDPSIGRPHPVYVPAGGRVTGTLVAEDCSAPNPGSPTATFALSLMIGQSDSLKGMTQASLSVDAPIRQLRGE